MNKQFELMAEYNQWMNSELANNLRKLTSEQVYSDRNAFFGSAFHTFSHVFTCDLIWLSRFTSKGDGDELQAALSAFSSPQSIKDHLYSDLSGLLPARQRLDGIILTWTKSISEVELTQPIRYKNKSGQEFEEPFAQVLMHFFNHQTHHRGQLTTLLSQSGDHDYCSDLLALIRR